MSKITMSVHQAVHAGQSSAKKTNIIIVIMAIWIIVVIFAFALYGATVIYGRLSNGVFQNGNEQAVKALIGTTGPERDKWNKENLKKFTGVDQDTIHNKK